MTTSDTWLGNLDVQTYVDTQKQRELSNLTTLTNNQLLPLQTEETTLTAQMTNYSNVDKLLSTLSADITQLNSVFNPTPQISTSNPNVVSATQVNGETLTSGTHTLDVSTLAQASTFASTAQTSSSAALNSTDVLTLQMAGGSPSITVNVQSTDSLQSIASSINSQASALHPPMGVSASVVQSSSGNYKLVVNSTQTGLANAVTVTDDSTGSATALGVASSQPAQDATFTFDGIQMDQSSNNNIVVGGLNLNLSGTGNGNIVVSSTSPVSTVVSATQTVVNDYNNVMIELEKDQTISGTDSSLANVQSALQNIFQSQSLYGIGISIEDVSKVQPIAVTLANGKGGEFTPGGLATLDTKQLTASLSSNYSTVQTLLSDPVNGLMTQVNNLIQPGGGIDVALHDPTFGAEPSTQSQITGINAQVAQIKSVFTAQQTVLTSQFGALAATLTKLQLQSQALSQEITSIGS